MKKTICLLLALMLSLSAAACGSIGGVELPPLPDVEAIKAEEAAKAEAEAAAQAAEVQAAIEASQPTEPPVLENHVIVNIGSFGGTHMDPQNGTEPILEYSYELPAVYVEGRDDVSAAINEHMAAIAETYQTGNDYGYGTSTGLSLLLEMATDNYSYIVNTGEDHLPMLYSTDQSVKVCRADEKALSLRYNTYEFTGGAHGNYIDRAYTFDTETGERVTLEMLAENTDELKAFLKEQMVSLYEKDEGGYYSERIPDSFLVDTSPADAIGALVREGSWSLTEKGIMFFSDIYELGPYAAGICEFEIPYSLLEGKIYDRYMPAEKSGEGSFSFTHQSEFSDGSAQIIDRVTVDPDGEPLCLVADGIVYDVRLSRVSYLDKFYENAQLWACSYMSDCILQLDAVIPDGIPDLMLSYTDGAGERHSLLLSQSGEDGIYFLADDDIEAVG